LARTPSAPIQLQDYEEQVLRSLRRIMQAVDLYSRRLISEHGLSTPQLVCLRRLQWGPLPSGELAAQIHSSAATVCGILDRLEARGLVVRERQTDDKRRVLVQLTSAGRKIIRRTPAPLQESFLSKLRALPLGQQAEIDRVLNQLVTLMADELEPELLVTSQAALAVAAPRGSRMAPKRRPRD
jgi:DNA-binding MarR family transcriptional regulator